MVPFKSVFLGKGGGGGGAGRSILILRVLVSDCALLPRQFAEIMMKIEEYISKQAKASEGTSSASLSSVHSPDPVTLASHGF